MPIAVNIHGNGKYFIVISHTIQSGSGHQYSGSSTEPPDTGHLQQFFIPSILINILWKIGCL